jgi:hypothetical protein
MFTSLIINVPNRIRLDPPSIETETEPDIGTSDIGLKRAESDIMLDIGIKFYPITDNRRPLLHS